MEKSPSPHLYLVTQPRFKISVKIYRGHRKLPCRITLSQKFLCIFWCSFMLMRQLTITNVSIPPKNNNPVTWIIFWTHCLVKEERLFSESYLEKQLILNAWSCMNTFQWVLFLFKKWTSCDSVVKSVMCLRASVGDNLYFCGSPSLKKVFFKRWKNNYNTAYT